MIKFEIDNDAILLIAGFLVLVVVAICIFVANMHCADIGSTCLGPHVIRGDIYVNPG